MEKMRLNRFLSLAGIDSRRKADEIIAQGRVYVNGSIVKEAGTIIDPNTDVVKIGNKRMTAKKFEYLIINKPRGIISSRKLDSGRGTIYDIIPKNMKHLKPVGRLDINTEGLIIMTNDGTLINRLSHPKGRIERVYSMLINKRLSYNEIQRLKRGIRYENISYRFSDVFFTRITPHGFLYIAKLKEGKNREIRNAMKALGKRIIWLKRISFGPIKLGELKPGQFRFLTKQELDLLNKLN
ncbi:rRNA pseudouridine synthase [candidate division WOR-3 bacterium]|uniref:Pseudouridine synthase n=1 Tax=candidate division TA06 bacterium TaxID=2250710 RepID=A0A660SAA2_UNCT6|nr:rRNA pseudouridine synthase [candidate division WOR-3 bacterium]RKX66595.1 MAG: pseudouridine synthase [candidate division TA06 bacterium]